MWLHQLAVNSIHYMVQSRAAEAAAWPAKLYHATHSLLKGTDALSQKVHSGNHFPCHLQLGLSVSNMQIPDMQQFIEQAAGMGWAPHHGQHSLHHVVT